MNTTRIALIACAVVLGSAEARAQTPGAAPPDPATTRQEQLGFDLITGAALAPIAAGYNQVLQDPPAWPKSWSGYGRRLASEAGRLTVEAGVTNGVAAALREPVGYVPCRCQTGGNRWRWALASGVTHPPPQGGRRRLAVGKLVGPYAGAFVQTLWTPAIDDRARRTVVNGTLSLAVNTLLNLILEARAHP